MAYETHRFCWHGAISTDPERASAFYAEVIGWGVRRVPMGEGEVSVFVAGGVPFAHLAATREPGEPSRWDSYLRVDDVDAATARAAAAGGRVQIPPTDIPPGRFSTVTSPSGAALCLFHESDASAEHHPGGEGGVHWLELHSRDLGADLAWLGSVFGLDARKMQMPDGDYFVLEQGGKQWGGAMAVREAEAAPMWLPWIHVDDVDAVLSRTERHGGRVLAPSSEVPGVGRLAIVADPTGGVLGVITPAKR